MQHYSTSHNRARVFITIQLVLGLLALAGFGNALAVTDAALQARIEFLVQHEPRLNGTDVRIIIDGGNVVLSGQVSLLSQKMLYEQITWQTGGTIDVDSEIRVVPVTAVSDLRLTVNIRAVIQQHKSLQGVDVSVKDGVAILHGTFNSATDVLFLKWKVAEIEGVIRILIESQFLARR